jgi:hypothetical protein
MITESSTFNQIAREAVFNGTLRWLLPVNDTYGEIENATKVAQVWLSAYSDASNSVTPSESSLRGITIPFASNSFPYWVFIPACYKSHSMMNRKRLWGIVKQFDILWKDYRLNGWERDHFAV